jgi:membrane-bound lytic murein transglycosylase D
MRTAERPEPIAERPMVRCSTERRGHVALLSAAALVAAACGSGVRTAPAITPSTPAAVISTPQPPAVETPAEDPVAALIALSNRHFTAGQQELELGHVERAKQEFDLAISVLLESQYGGRTEPTIREHFDRLVDRISAYEVKALAEGDGFTEKRYEPASIDELLAMSATFAVPATAALSHTVAGDLESVAYDVPIPFNPKVLSYIELFQGRLHDFIQEGLTRGSKYLPMIQGVFRAEGLPLDLAYIPLIESAFKPNALSRAKAKGVWQFMRGTGLENGLRSDWYVDERSDVEKATQAAAKYLATLSKMFDGDWHLALASYNGGPGRVQRAIKRTRQDDFWKLASRSGVLPRETREYVPMILAAVVIARNPAQYGFEFAAEPAPVYDVVTLPGPVDLRRIAEWIDLSLDELQSLNPELRRWTTPVKDTAYELKVPVGTAETINAKLEEAATTDLASLKWHTVRKGETLATIARKLRVSRTDLAEANYLRTSSRVAAGQKLIVPQGTTVLMAARTDRPVPVAESRPLKTPAVVPAMAGQGNPDRVKMMYQVKRGDTLASIARAFKTTVESLQTWNRIPGTQIRAGERLTVYALRAN